MDDQQQQGVEGEGGEGEGGEGEGGEGEGAEGEGAEGEGGEGVVKSSLDWQQFAVLSNNATLFSC